MKNQISLHEKCRRAPSLRTPNQLMTCLAFPAPFTFSDTLDWPISDAWEIWEEQAIPSIISVIWKFVDVCLVVATCAELYKSRIKYVKLALRLKEKKNPSPHWLLFPLHQTWRCCPSSASSLPRGWLWSIPLSSQLSITFIQLSLSVCHHQ